VSAEFAELGCGEAFSVDTAEFVGGPGVGDGDVVDDAGERGGEAANDEPACWCWCGKPVENAEG
jgi:hypothetical protein